MSTNNEKSSKYTKPQRIAALICVVLIVLLYLAALIFNILKFEWAQTVGRIALGATLVLPILTWVYIWLIGNLTRRHTIADFDFGGVPTDHSGARVDDDKAESETTDSDITR